MPRDWGVRYNFDYEIRVPGGEPVTGEVWGETTDEAMSKVLAYGRERFGLPDGPEASQLITVSRPGYTDPRLN